MALLVWDLLATLQTPGFKAHISTTRLLVAVILSTTIILASWFFAKFLTKKNRLIIFISILALVLLKFIFVLRFPIAPTSDFWNYHVLASYNVLGMTWSKMWTQGYLNTNIIWPHVINISWFYSVFYSFFRPNYLVAQCASILLSGVNAILLFSLCQHFVSKRAAIFAALIFYAIPAYWLYTLLNGAEPIFLTFLLGALICYHRAMYAKGQRLMIEHYFYFGFSLLLLFLANMVRPIALVWIVVIVFFSIFRLKSRQKEFPRRIWFNPLAYAVIFVLLNLASTPIYRVLYGVPFAPTTVLNQYSLAIGTNVKTGGMYAGGIRQQVDQDLNQKSLPLTKRFDKVTTDMQKISKHNIQTLNQTRGWVPFLRVKTINLMREDYGSNWILYNLKRNRDRTTYYTRLSAFLSVYSTIFFVILLVLAGLVLLLSPWLIYRQRSFHIPDLNRLFYGLLLWDGFMLSSLIFEVQGRYHIILYVPLLLIITWGHDRLFQRNKLG
ncbi:integral membrane protein [Agrilactobacillus composti DSM 18527 = JCM 14202]|nr:integral membrane protein [Agrilactobacillus composti DSM 18527 = JCM 14202]